MQVLLRIGARTCLFAETWKNASQMRNFWFAIEVYVNIKHFSSLKTAGMTHMCNGVWRDWPIIQRQNLVLEWLIRPFICRKEVKLELKLRIIIMYNSPEDWAINLRNLCAVWWSKCQVPCLHLRDFRPDLGQKMVDAIFSCLPKNTESTSSTPGYCHMNLIATSLL